MSPSGVDACDRCGEPILDCEGCMEDGIHESLFQIERVGLTIPHYHVLLVGGSFAQAAGHNLKLPPKSPQNL